MSSLVAALEYLERINTAVGLLLSSILLYGIRRFSPAQFGAYKHLLTAFAVTDIFLVVQHAIVHPRTVLVGTTHGVSTDTFIDDRSVTATYIAFQSVPFTLLIVHFLYRFLSVRYPHLLHVFKNKQFVMLLGNGIFGEVTSWYLLSMFATTDPEDAIGKQYLIEECESKYGRHIENAWIVLDHWRGERFDSKLFATIITTNVLMISSIFLASTLAILSFHHISNIDNRSIQLRKLHRKLLIALCAQTSVPLFFVHIPSLIAINLPYFRISVWGIHDFVSPVYTCFPVWDAAVIILLISDYRRGLHRWIIRSVMRNPLIEVSTLAVSNV